MITTGMLLNAADSCKIVKQMILSMDCTHQLEVNKWTTEKNVQKIHLTY